MKRENNMKVAGRFLHGVRDGNALTVFKTRKGRQLVCVDGKPNHNIAYIGGLGREQKKTTVDGS
ncbi:MAG: hypothetical protein GY861_25225 [bacterium]|nr:hypothetical protein [bacterium]